MQFETALRIQRGEVIAFVGAGGKTSALFRLAHELAADGWRVLATTTTRVAAAELRLAPRALTEDRVWASTAALSEALNTTRLVFLYSHIQHGKARGISPDFIRALLDRVSSDVILVEADGARRLPFKAPYAHEPVVPQETTRVVLSAGMDVLGQPLDGAHVYNPETMIRRFGYPAGAPVLWPWVASVLRDEQLGLSNLPPAVPVTALLNKTPVSGPVRRQAQLIASLLLRSRRIDSVIIGDMQSRDEPVVEVRRPVAALVLAAGKSSRMGQSKVLLPWGRETVLEAIIRQLYTARLEHIAVVTGHSANRVARIAERYGAQIVYNPDYESGEMLSSVQAGLRALDERFDGVLIVLGDQPQLQGYVIARVLEAYASGGKGIVIPSFEMRRGHPVLFGRRHWRGLLELPASGAPRDLVNANADDIAYVNVSTDSILQDIDTPEDYERALRRAGLV